MKTNKTSRAVIKTVASLLAVFTLVLLSACSTHSKSLPSPSYWSTGMIMATAGGSCPETRENTPPKGVVGSTCGKSRLKRYLDERGEVQTVKVYRYYCHNPACRYLGVFEKVYRFTPFSDDAQARIRGKCPLELAGYDIQKLPMSQLFRGLALQWPVPAFQELVPTM